MLQREITQFSATPDYRGRYHLIHLAWRSHIYQQRPNTMFDESMDAGTKLQRFPHWPVLKGNNVLVSWFQVARIVKDAEDSLSSLVPVLIKPPCERWGQLYGPHWLPGNCILQSDGVDMLIHDTIFIIYNINIHIWCKAAFIIVSVRKRRRVSELNPLTASGWGVYFLQKLSTRNQRNIFPKTPNYPFKFRWCCGTPVMGGFYPGRSSTRRCSPDLSFMRLDVSELFL